MKRSRCLACLLLLTLAALLAAVPSRRSVNGGPIAGVHTIRADETILRLARDAGFSRIVQLLEWREIEPTPAEYLWEYPDWLVRASEYYGLDLVLRLDHPPQWALLGHPDGSPVDPQTYADFVGRVATRYRGKVRTYVVWNEPNLASEWGDLQPNPAAYVALLQTAYEAIKAADPTARVVSAGLAPTNDVTERALDERLFLQRMYAAGAKGHFDALGAHPYGFAYPPDDASGAHNGFNFARLTELRRIMTEADDADTPVWATEVGWTTAPVEPEQQWLRVTEKQQADYLIAAFEKARREWPWLELLTVWNQSVGLPASDEKRGYSILGDDYHPLPAYEALAAMLPPLPSPSDEAEPAQAIEILAPDVVVRLGDVDTYYPHWARPYCRQIPCRRWLGQFYVADDPGTTPWRLSMETMQVEEHGNLVLINGQPVDPPAIPLRGEPDFASVWTAAELSVPAGVLQQGPNVIEVRLSPRLPVYHGATARFESLQFRNVRLTPLGSAAPR
jgi:hypothetical protein